jgi:hypothetical protein
MNFAGTVHYLQAMVQEEPSRTGNVRDLGWCCSEHALILALALRERGIPAYVAQGAVFIRLEKWEDVVNHFFVSTPDHSIYDTSLKFEQVRGISPEKVEALAVSLHVTDKPPTEIPRDFGVRYYQYATHDPSRYTTISSKTPYGDWLTSLGVDHPRFWGAAAAAAGAILADTTIPPEVLPGRQILVEQTLQGSYLQSWPSVDGSTS